MRPKSSTFFKQWAGLFLLAVPLAATAANDTIRVNQLGYYPHQEKIAVTDCRDIKTFTITNTSTGQTVFSGKPLYSASSEWSDKVRTILDFSPLKVPGNYQLTIDGKYTVPFSISNQALLPLSRAALKAFYYQRCSLPIEETYAGKWTRPAGHPDTQVIIHASAASFERPAGTVISSPKGWYDAGDYNKYIVNSAFTIGLMLSAYQAFPEYFTKLETNIPESGNGIPDLLDETYYNLVWMLSMQDPADGGVYHKLTTPSFEGFIRPEDCKQPRYVVQKSVTATLDFAAVMAQGSRLFTPYDSHFKGFSEKAIQAAEKAYAWAAEHPESYYDQRRLNSQFQPAISTGEYGDRNAQDEFFWAATELYLSTGKSMYLQDAAKYAPHQYTLPVWGNLSALGVFSWMQASAQKQEAGQKFLPGLKQSLIHLADSLIQGADVTPFHAPYGHHTQDFFWGSLSDQCASQGISLIHAYLLSKKETYLNNAYRNMDYLLGRNATGYCYVTGIGFKSPKHPHHRLSVSDGINEPIPGFLVGGPNPQPQMGLPAFTCATDEAYLDQELSYTTNEIAINWNASLLTFSAMLDTLASSENGQ